MALITQNRSAASGRSAASNRRLLDPMTYSLLGEGGTDEITPGDVDMVGDGATTIEIIHKTSGAGTTTRNAALFDCNNEWGCYLKDSGGGWVYNLATFGSNIDSLLTGFVQPYNTWIKTVCVYDQNNNRLSLYSDGVLLAENNSYTDNSADTANNLRFMIAAGGAALWKGRMARIRVWASRALDDTEVLQMYVSGKAPYRDDLLLEYLMTDGSGTTLTDTSGNGNDGTITGAAWDADVPSKARTART